jgi:hypothetical protein
MTAVPPMFHTGGGRSVDLLRAYRGHEERVVLNALAPPDIGRRLGLRITLLIWDQNVVYPVARRRSSAAENDHRIPAPH